MAAYEEQEYNNPFSFRIWMKLFPFFKPYKKFFAITLGLNILLAGVDILVPLFQSYAIDTFIIPDRLDGLGALPWFIFLLLWPRLSACRGRFTRLHP